LVRRAHAEADKWHEATDDATGTESYGAAKNNPTGSASFSVQYNKFKWDKIMFAWGDLSQWIILVKSEFDGLVARSDCV
jgi:hypothetical protein